jgi:IS30 family transposase
MRILCTLGCAIVCERPRRIQRTGPKGNRDPDLQVSHETIYRSLFLQSRGVLKRALLGELRRQRHFRHARTAARTRPWPRGSNDNTNGLLRQYLPPATDLSRYSQPQLDAIARRMNTRPRLTLEYRTPAAKLAEIVASMG